MVRTALLVPLALILVPAAPAAGQCRLCATSEAESQRETPPEVPIRIEIESALDFSRVTTSGQTGEARIDPLSGSHSVSGGLTSLGGMPFRGSARVTGTPRKAIRVDLPRRIQLHASTGAVAEVTDIETDLPPAPTLGSDGVLTFSFGGRLSVRGAATGVFRGQIPITADYQ